MRYRVAFIVTHGNAQRRGKKSKSTYFTQEERWAFDDKSAAGLLNLAFHALSADQWKYFLTTVAEGERSALSLASRWSAALTAAASEVLTPEAMRARSAVDHGEQTVWSVSLTRR
jgi:hypothetical protein